MRNELCELAMLVRRDPDSCTVGAALITATIVFIHMWVALVLS